MSLKEKKKKRKINHRRVGVNGHAARTFTSLAWSKRMLPELHALCVRTHYDSPGIGCTGFECDDSERASTRSTVMESTKEDDSTRHKLWGSTPLVVSSHSLSLSLSFDMSIPPFQSRCLLLMTRSPSYPESLGRIRQIIGHLREFSPSLNVRRAPLYIREYRRPGTYPTFFADHPEGWRAY